MLHRGAPHVARPHAPSLAPSARSPPTGLPTQPCLPLPPPPPPGRPTPARTLRREGASERERAHAREERDLAAPRPVSFTRLAGHHVASLAAALRLSPLARYHTFVRIDRQLRERERVKEREKKREESLSAAARSSAALPHLFSSVRRSTADERSQLTNERPERPEIGTTGYCHSRTLSVSLWTGKPGLVVLSVGSPVGTEKGSGAAWRTVNFFLVGEPGVKWGSQRSPRAHGNPSTRKEGGGALASLSADKDFRVRVSMDHRLALRTVILTPRFAPSDPRC